MYKLDLVPAMELPPHPRGNSVHYDFLKHHCIGNKITHVNPLAMGAFACNSHVTKGTLKTIKVFWRKY